MFYLIGLGLGDATDITVKGLEIVKRAKRVYLEAYTSILTVGKEALVRFLFVIVKQQTDIQGFCVLTTVQVIMFMTDFPLRQYQSLIKFI